MPFFHLESENHDMRLSIYMRGQNKSNLYFVESLVETESDDTVWIRQRAFTQWDLVMYVCIRELHQKGSNNGVLPERHQATVGTSVGRLSKGPLGDKFNEIVIQMRSFSLKILYCIKCCLQKSHFDSVSVCQSTWYGYTSNFSSKFLAWPVRHQLYIFFLNKFRSFTFLTQGGRQFQTLEPRYLNDL